MASDTSTKTLWGLDERDEAASDSHDSDGTTTRLENVDLSVPELETLRKQIATTSGFIQEITHRSRLGHDLVQLEHSFLQFEHALL